ncbi:MAG: hypothetical protein KKF48_03680 [Nanoarchaeota archaeon]|nr:hypothetical protein [Nanoarchaeota archaeon]MBU1028120.1 hypothetical protein [Nanoarchaeota archaeon]
MERDTKVKSELQKKLENQGWKFLTNDDPYRGERHGFNPSFFRLKTDLDLEQKYLDGGFKEVYITDAFDINGNPIPSYRAIYVKK